MNNQSEFGVLKSVFIKPPQHAFINDEQLEQQWQSHQFLAKPYYQESLKEYGQFEEIFKKNGCILHYLPYDSSVSIDSIYCRDAAIATNQGMIICRMGKEARANEPMAERNFFKAANFPIVGEITSPGTVEGGDAAWLDTTTLAVGRSYRTNPEGIRQLKELLAPLNVEVITVDLPHYKGVEDVFHLMSVFSPVDKDLAVVYSPLIPISFRNLLIDKGFNFIEVPNEEFESMGCNVLAIAPRKCIMVSGNPITQKQLTQAGAEVFEYSGKEISIKGGGGPTCLTRPWLRS